MSTFLSVFRSKRVCWFVAFGLPLFALWLWLTFGYTHRYAVTTQFVLRNQQDTASMALGAASLLGAGGEQQDLHMLQEYILSPNLLAKLDAELDLRGQYASADILPPQRLASDASFDALLEKYRSLIDISIDATSGIMTYTVEGYASDQVLRQARATLAAAEAYVNDVSHQIAARQTAAAREHLDKTREDHTAKTHRLLTFQQENNTFMPDKDGAAALSVIGGLEGALAEERARLAGMLAYLAPTAPGVIESRAKIKAMEDQIALERTRLVSAKLGEMERQATPFNQLLASYQLVQMELELATKSYSESLAALQNAQIAASENLKSLVMIASPHAPQEHAYPRVWVWMLVAGVVHLFLAAPLAARLRALAPRPAKRKR